MIRMDRRHCPHRIDECGKYDTEDDAHRRELRVHVKSQRKCSEDHREQYPKNIPIFI